MKPEFRVRLLSEDGEKIFGEGPYRLLRGVERLGSLRAAAMEQGMAYSKASRIIGRAEELLGAPLTEKRIGGSDGGGSALTPVARELMARYEAFRGDCAAAVEASFAERFADFLRPALGCVVLAAGRARRFGGRKLLADLDGAPVLTRTLDALPRDCFCRVVAVTSDPEVTALCRAKGVPAREYPGGPLSDSIREGLAEMDGTAGCMFVNGDQPLLRTESLRRMAAAFAASPACVIRLAHGGIAASPAILPASAYPALRVLEGEAGGMAAVRGGGWEICAVEAESAAELWDVDDPAALDRAQKYLQGKTKD